MENLGMSILLTFRKWKLQSRYFFLGLFGLAIAFAVTIVVISFFRYEFTYDHNLPHRDQIYMLSTSNWDEHRMADISLGKALEEGISEIEASTVFHLVETGFYHDNGDVFNTRVAGVSPTFFEVFNLKLISGSLAQELQPHEIFITKSTALKQFGNIDVIGKEMTTKDDIGYIDSYIVKGVLEDFPSNSSLQLDAINMSYPRLRSGLYAYTFIKFKDGANPQQLESQISAIHKSLNFTKDQHLHFESLRNLHFSNNEQMQQVFGARPLKLSITLGSIALLILIVTSINYINLSIARSSEYVKEIGVRKTLGASKRSIALQFTMDSVMLFMVAIPLAYLFAWSIFPYLKENLQIAMNAGYIFEYQVICFIILIVLFISIPCGIYPVLRLIRSSGSELMKAGFKSSTSKIHYRNILVTIQYSLSVILIILSTVIYTQVQLLKDKPLGFSKDHLIILPDAALRGNYSAFKAELLSVPGVISTSISNIDLGTLQEPKRRDSIAPHQYVVGDLDFVKTTGLHLLEGTDFDKTNAHHRKYNSDYMLIEPGKKEEFKQKQRERPIIVTQDLLTNLGLNTDEAVGRELDISGKGEAIGTVIGVVAPFDFGPQRGASNSKILLGDYNSYYGGYSYIKIESHHIPSTLAGIQKVWKKFLGNHEFGYSFADERVDRLYRSEQGLISVILLLTAISCSLSILGAVSLLALTIAQRTKEIGIRKVLGASVYRIVYLITRDSIGPIILSFAIAFPVGAWISHKWLEDYADRVDISWWTFALAAAICITATACALSYQSIKAALTNPVISLRDE